MQARTRLRCLLITLVLGVPACAQPRSPSGAEVKAVAGSSASTTRDKTSREPKPRSRHCYKGVPTATKSASQFVLLKNTGYDVGYSEKRKDPLWAAYTLRGDQELHEVKRPKSKKFAKDNRVASGITHGDYTNSGYDRGHMAPSDAIGKWFGQTGQNATFIVTNICPQKHKMNDEVWGGLEAAEVYHFADQFEQIWVICGPIFGPDPDTIGNGVQVPEAFFKIIVEDDNDQPEILAVIIDQDAVGTDHALKEYTDRVTVDKIEEKSGLDFFAELPDEVEDTVEAAGTNNELWNTKLMLNDNKMRRDVEGEAE